MEDAVRKLAFGHTWSDVPAATAAWGARWIWPNDQVYNRQDSQGDEQDLAELFKWLRETVKGRPFDAARSLSPYTDSDRPVVLYEDDKGRFIGHAHSSCGYLYVVAYLKDHLIPEPVASAALSRSRDAETLDRMLGFDSCEANYGEALDG